MMLSKLLFVACMLAGATTVAACAVEDPEQGQGIDESTAASSAERAQQPAFDPFEPVEESAKLPDDTTAAAQRYVQGDGACHTFDYLRRISNDFCWQAFGSLGAWDRNYTQGCTGWWGNGARYVWFSCLADS